MLTIRCTLFVLMTRVKLYGWKILLELMLPISCLIISDLLINNPCRRQRLADKLEISPCKGKKLLLFIFQTIFIFVFAFEE